MAIDGRLIHPKYVLRHEHVPVWNIFLGDILRNKERYNILFFEKKIIRNPTFNNHQPRSGVKAPRLRALAAAVHLGMLVSDPEFSWNVATEFGSPRFPGCGLLGYHRRGSRE